MQNQRKEYSKPKAKSVKKKKRRKVKNPWEQSEMDFRNEIERGGNRM